MSGPERIAALGVGVALATTLVLPKRQSVGVINAFGNAISNWFATIMGTSKAQNIPS